MRTGLHQALNIIKNSALPSNINLRDHNIGYQEVREIAEQLKQSTASHVIDLSVNNIGDREVKVFAERLINSKVSHTIKLDGNKIGNQGIKSLEDMIKHSQFPSYITGTKDTLTVMHNNYATMAISQPEEFRLKIQKLFGSPLPIMKGYICDDLLYEITNYLTPQDLNHLNIQYLQEKRIAVLKSDINKEITPADANYGVMQNRLSINIHTLERIDKITAYMLLTENMLNLIPKEIIKGISEYIIDVKYLQYGTEIMLGTTAAYLEYDFYKTFGSSSYQGFGFRGDLSLPLIRAILFCFQDQIIDSLATSVAENFQEKITEYGYNQNKTSY